MPERILILSYFYAPCNLTASQRAHAWAKYLHNFSYYPVVVSRNWDIAIKSPPDGQKSTGEAIRHVKHENYEEYYLPYKANLRDRLLVRTYGTRWRFLSRILSFWELLLQNVTLRILPYYNIYEFLDQYLSENDDISKVVISGNPFILFAFGYHLKKKHNIKWIADYRDDWNTTDLTENRSFFHNLLRKIESRSEKKWVKTADLITSVSPYYTQKISNFVGVEGKTILNGYAEEDIVPLEASKLYPVFTLTYVGTLYNTQPIEWLLNALKRLINELNGNADIQLLLPGLGYMKAQCQRVEEQMKGYERFIHITNRVPKQEVMLIQQNSHILINITHTGVKGVIPSKIFEYVGLKKRILSFPSEEGIDEILGSSQLGLLANNEEECYNQIKSAYQMFKDNNTDWFKPVAKQTEQYSRYYSTQNIALCLNSI